MNLKLRFCIAEISMIKNWVPAISTGSIETQNMALQAHRVFQAPHMTFQFTAHPQTLGPHKHQS